MPVGKRHCELLGSFLKNIARDFDFQRNVIIFGNDVNLAKRKVIDSIVVDDCGFI